MLPTGTVTLLFTDVVGSTTLWEEEQASMTAALARHDLLVRAAIEEVHGHVFKTVGDAFCAVFSSAFDAVGAAVSLQRVIQEQSWETERPLSVRTALHSGICEERDGDYFGPTVNRTARLVAIGHGGQILVSETTAILLADSLAVVGQLKDLGQHRLKDLGRPEHVYQLVAQGLASRFAPLRSLSNPEIPNNLPTLGSSFIGRQRELVDVCALVLANRLVTLTGAGGSGKTRLALQTAAELLDGSGGGVTLIELSTITDGAQLPELVLEGLGVTRTSSDATAQLVSVLSDQRILLVLDNCEHVIDACARLSSSIVRDCPNVALLATSREPMGIDAEHVYRVPSMSMPESEPTSLQELAGFDAIELFLSRASSNAVVIEDRDAALVASVCLRLDGIPLALELAAARLESMSLSQLNDRLDKRFRLLTGGSRDALARHQTLLATVDWSYGLLSEEERQVLRGLSVFMNGFELEAAERVTSIGDIDEYDVADLVQSLVRKSLVVAEHQSGTVRFRLLESIREFAAQQMVNVGEADELEQLRNRHAEYFLGVASDAHRRLNGEEQAAALFALDLDIDNLRAMFARLREDPSRASDVLAGVSGLRRFIESRVLAEFIDDINEAIDRIGQARTMSALTSLLTEASLEFNSGGSPDAMRAHYEKASAWAREAQAWGVEVEAESRLATLERDLGERARRMDELVSRARQLDDSLVLSHVLTTAGGAHTGATASPHRLSLLEEARSIARTRRDLILLTRITAGIADWYALDGRLDLSVELSMAAIEMGESIRIPSGGARNNLIVDLLESGRYDEAIPQLRLNLRRARRIGQQITSVTSIVNAASCAAFKGDHEIAAQLYTAGQVHSAPLYAAGSLYRTELGPLLEQRDLDAARTALGAEAFDLAVREGHHLTLGQACDLALTWLAE